MTQTFELNPFALSPTVMQAMLALEESVRHAGLEDRLIELVKTRASQINGCAHCLHMHTTAARAAGESEMRLYLLSAWRDSPLYDDRERAALAWTEALTRIAQGHPDAAAYRAMRENFSDKERVDLTMLIAAINSWNRIAISCGATHPVETDDAAA